MIESPFDFYHPKTSNRFQLQYFNLHKVPTKLFSYHLSSTQSANSIITKRAFYFIASRIDSTMSHYFNACHWILIFFLPQKTSILIIRRKSPNKGTKQTLNNFINDSLRFNLNTIKHSVIIPSRGLYFSIKCNFSCLKI